MTPRLDRQVTGNVGLYYCCYQRSLMGWNVMPTARNAKGVDIVILAGHFQATCDRAQASAGPLLILQDTTEFSYNREEPEVIGFKGLTNSGRDKAGRCPRVPP